MTGLLFTAALLLGQTNLDLAKGNLDGWEGKGFALAPAVDGRPAGLSSIDDAKAGAKAMIRYQLTIPSGARQIAFQAFAEVQGDNEPGPGCTVIIAGADNVPLPRMVRVSNGTWSNSNRILLPWVGKPRTYAWDVSAHQGQLMQIVLIDSDPRPGHYLWAGDFKILGVPQASPAKNPANEPIDAEFADFMLSIQQKNKLNPMARFDSKRFSAISNAADAFTTERLQNCEVFYDLFLKHFQQKGFAVHAPTQRMMIAVFDTHAGFDAYFGRKMPTGIAGIYHTATNRLVLYDYAENRAMVANKGIIAKNSAGITDSFAKAKYVETEERKLTDVSKDANLSTTMHECAHQISFNCGLLVRMHDTPGCIVEGLACYCEATDHGDWTSLGGLNPMRIISLTRAQGKFIPLVDLIKDDEWIRTPHILLGYGQSWALFHMLMHERPGDLKKYLKVIADRRTPERRLEDFQSVFGNLAAFEQHYQAYLRDAIAKRGN